MAGVSFRSCVAFALLVALQHVIGPVMGQSLALSLAQFLAVAVRKVLPCVLVAYWVVETTGVGEFSAAKKQAIIDAGLHNILSVKPPPCLR